VHRTMAAEDRKVGVDELVVQDLGLCAAAGKID
jgi:hypothetical protein